ncbi:neural cell adhesion molecule 2-like isoform X2 [Mytilus californianus]|uniref:neural cell adhesion molecule 2-like isoform X2 n=1 Tax=Mytilus californianus TaxID=6549 RepID=UPI0022461620|nr:neural cell adhesion molecule 2-like isoform X2 [Mytilus californianus]
MKAKLILVVFIQSVYLCLTDAQNIIIEGDNPLVANGGDRKVIACKVVSGVANGENPDLKWYDNRGSIVTTSGRIFVLSQSATDLKLLLNDVQEDDAGSYNCTGFINGQLQSAHIVVKTKMPLIITEEQAPRTQLFPEGGSARIKCAPQGQVSVSWRDRNGTRIESSHERYVISPGYLEIPNVNRTDDGVYQCVVIGGGDFEVVKITVTVTVPPQIVKPPTAQSVSVGEAARFECVATAKPSPKYYWYFNSITIELTGERYNLSRDAGVLIIKKVIKDDAGTYKCVARSTDKSDEKDAALTVLVPPQINKLDNATGDEGTSATIKCTAYGEPIPKITWMKEGTSVEITDGTQIDNSDIVASQVARPDRMEVEGSLQISNLKSSDAGFYICKATNEAKSVEKSAYLSVQYKPNFSKVMKDVMYSWGGQSTNIKCIATGVPSADISWAKGGQTINAGDQYYSLKSVTIGEDTESTLTVSVDFSNEAIVFGVYTCKAGNAIGESTKNFTLQRADPPPSPSARLKETTPISITFDVNIPKTFNGPPVQEIEVRYSNAQPRKERVGTMDSKIEIVLDNLTPGTAYNIKVYAKNEVGLSPEYSLPTQTLQARKPYPIVVRSKPYGDYPLKFNLQWNTPNNGGFPISSVYVKYAQVEVFPNKSASNEFQRKEYISGWNPPITVDGAATAYEITSLKPSSYYEVEVTAVNNKGTSDARAFIFVTSKEEPTTEAPVEEITSKPSKKSQDTNSSAQQVPLGIVIAIIIIVVIILFIVIDVTCYYKRKCGVFMCIKEKVGRTGSMETRSKEKIIEEGDADGKTVKSQEQNENGVKLQDLNKEEKSNSNPDESQEKKKNEPVSINKEVNEKDEVKKNGSATSNLSSEPKVKLSEKPLDDKQEKEKSEQKKESANSKQEELTQKDQKQKDKTKSDQTEKGVKSSNIPPQSKTTNQKLESSQQQVGINKGPVISTVINGGPKNTSDQKPVEPKQQKPVETKQQKPVEPKQQKPVEPKQQKPVEPKQQKPVEPKQKNTDEPKETVEVKKKTVKKQLDFKDDEEKKVPLLADNKDTEGSDADQEIGETAPSDEKEPEDKEEKPITPVKEVEEAEEAKPEDQDKPASPKEETKEVTDGGKE